MFGAEFMAGFFGYWSAHAEELPFFVVMVVVVFSAYFSLREKILMWERSLTQAQIPSTLAAEWKNCLDLFSTREYCIRLMISLVASTISVAVITDEALLLVILMLPLNSLSLIPFPPKTQVVLAFSGTLLIMCSFWVCFTLTWKVMSSVWPDGVHWRGSRLLLALFSTSTADVCLWICVGLMKGFCRLLMKTDCWFSSSPLRK